MWCPSIAATLLRPQNVASAAEPSLVTRWVVCGKPATRAVAPSSVIDRMTLFPRSATSAAPSAAIAMPDGRKNFARGPGALGGARHAPGGRGHHAVGADPADRVVLGVGHDERAAGHDGHAERVIEARGAVAPAGAVDAARHAVARDGGHRAGRVDPA